MVFFVVKEDKNIDLLFINEVDGVHAVPICILSVSYDFQKPFTNFKTILNLLQKKVDPLIYYLCIMPRYVFPSNSDITGIVAIYVSKDLILKL